MNIKEILKKMSEGKELSTEEKAFLDGYDPEKDESRIPKSRLDQEIAKKEAEKARADGLETKVSELADKVEKMEANGMTEVEKITAANAKELKKLQDQAVTLTKERDDAAAKFAQSERAAKVSTLAAKHNFSDADYLDYLANSKEIDLNDESALAGFMKELGICRPELFKSNAKPGGGTGGDIVNDVSGYQARINELMGKPELSSREAGEVIDLQSKIKSGSTETKSETK